MVFISTSETVAEETHDITTANVVASNVNNKHLES